MSTPLAVLESPLLDEPSLEEAAGTSGSPLLARLADYVELTKPKIAVLELATVAVATCVATLNAPDAGKLLAALLGTALVAGSASAGNQWLERGRDARMPRTAGRPLPAGRLASREVLVFAAVTGLLGLATLAVSVNLLTAGLALASWVLYVGLYTPLKTRSSLNTVVGAVAGGLPILIGWASAAMPLDLAAATLFMIVFLWQFPHFMAIAWIYRQQYADAGMQMLPVVDPSGLRAGVQAVVAALALLPVSLLPAVVHYAGPVYLVGALLLGLGQLALAAWFLVRRSDRAARLLLRASLVYLPALMLLLLVCPAP